MKEQLRAKLVFGKFPVLERSGDRMRVSLGGTTEVNIILSPLEGGSQYDVRAGDLLTIYTEVFITPPKGS